MALYNKDGNKIINNNSGSYASFVDRLCSTEFFKLPRKDHQSYDDAVRAAYNDLPHNSPLTTFSELAQKVNKLIKDVECLKKNNDDLHPDHNLVLRMISQAIGRITALEEWREEVSEEDDEDKERFVCPVYQLRRYYNMVKNK